ncbi:MAG: nicotinate-nucleotide adenylyltransferase, partial [Anaerolineales bacterium]|nr:nicotinate-nucleotide adenylyltransferase [Anaerolineales bacterium]
MARLGIFGGTFDPPHLGHLILGQEACFQLDLDRLLWVVTADPPHKTDSQLAPVEARMAMVLAAIEGNAYFELSRIEVDRPGPHFAVDTLRLLRERYPDDELIYLIGGDSLRDLPDWNEPLEFIQTYDALGVMRRPDDQVDLDRLEAVLPGLTERLRFVDAPLLDISSSQLRRRIRAFHPVQYYMPPAVLELIIERRLYRDNVPA